MSHEPSDIFDLISFHFKHYIRIRFWIIIFFCHLSIQSLVPCTVLSFQIVDTLEKNEYRWKEQHCITYISIQTEPSGLHSFCTRHHLSQQSFLQKLSGQFSWDSIVRFILQSSHKHKSRRLFIHSWKTASYCSTEVCLVCCKTAVFLQMCFYTDTNLRWWGHSVVLWHPFGQISKPFVLYVQRALVVFDCRVFKDKY